MKSVIFLLVLLVLSTNMVLSWIAAPMILHSRPISRFRKPQLSPRGYEHLDVQAFQPRPSILLYADLRPEINQEEDNSSHDDSSLYYECSCEEDNSCECDSESDYELDSEMPSDHRRNIQTSQPPHA